MTPARCSPQNTAAPDSPAHGEPPALVMASRDSMVRAKVPASRSLIGDVRPNACSACRPPSRVADAAGKPTAPQSSGSGPASRPHRTARSARRAGQASTATSRAASAHATLACSQPPPCGPATSTAWPSLTAAPPSGARTCAAVSTRPSAIGSPSPAGIFPCRRPAVPTCAPPGSPPAPPAPPSR